jgi:hypothetical protein
VTVRTSTDVYYGPYDVDLIADPYPTYQRVRDEAPVYWCRDVDSGDQESRQS